jgi:hypothetical protein
MKKGAAEAARHFRGIIVIPVMPMDRDRYAIVHVRRARVLH